MYQTPRRLSELDAETAAGTILLRAVTSVPDAACQYRLYVIGPDHPSADPSEQGRFLIVRVGDDGKVHEVAAPIDLRHQEWAETLFDRLWDGLEDGTLPGSGDGDAEEALAEDIVNGPDPEPTRPVGPAPRPPEEADVVWTATSGHTEELTPGVRVLYPSTDQEHALDPDDLIEAVDLIEAIVRSRPDPVTGDILVQDVDEDDEPFPIAVDRIVSHHVPTVEKAAPPSRFRPAGQHDLAPSGRMARVRANIAAIRVLHDLREQRRPATPEEQAVLARWSSWGAVPGIFDPRQHDFSALRGQLRSLLTEAEWHAAEATTRNAHFTDASLVEPVWKALADLGFTGGRVLEPGSGSGNFIAFAPDSAQMTGVELDPVTAEVSRALYPDAEIRNESFVATRYPEAYFDASIGNVPFDEIAMTDPLHNPLRLATHNHFIVKALELTRPGGLVAVLTSRYTLDSTGRTARLEIADRADLVGAVRLPAGAHWAAAGTKAVTDLLILRRRDGEPPVTPPDWVGLSRVALDEETSILVNSHFQRHPEMVLGTHAVTSSQFTDKDITVRPAEGVDLGQALTRALAGVTRKAHEDGLTMSASPAAEQRAAVERRVERMRFAEEMFGNDLDRFEGTVIDQHDGTFLQIAGGELTERTVFKNAGDELTSLLRLRDTYVSLLSAESTSGAEDGATALRTQLNDHYDAHTAKYGFLNVRQSRRDPRTAHGTFRTDPYAAGVYALEIYDQDTGTAKKSAIFTKAVTHPQQEQNTAETPQDALAISLNRYREVRLGEIAELLGLESLDEARQALGDLVFNEPGTQKLVLAADYLSGDLGEKLEQVESVLRMVSPERREQHPFQANAEALRRTMPPPKTPGDIEDIQIGATWIAPRHYQDFIRQLLQSQFVDVACESGADWEVTAPRGVLKSRAATVVYGTAKRNAVELFQRLLRRNSLVVHPGKLDEDASPEDIANAKRVAAEQTEQAVAKAEELNRLFGDWLWQDHERATDVLNAYNRRFNSWVPYQGDGNHLTFPGLSDQVVPRPHQRAGVARALHEGGHSFFDYEVGFGKTYTIAMTLMEMKRLGMVSKPCVVVKNPTVGDFRNDFLKCYPTARVLAIDSADFTKDTAAAYIAQIANGDWDAVILPQSLFKRIPVSGRGQEQFVADQTAEYRARIHKILTGSDDALAPGLNPGGDPLVAESLDVAAANSTELRHVSSRTKDTIKRLQGDLKRHTQRAQKNLVKNTMTGISWEQTGIDGIVVDEVQDFANAEIGANNSELSLTVSAQSRDLMVKLRNPNNRVAIGSTGTPFPNAMPQAYVMLNYFRPDLLERAGLSAFSSFQAQYLTETMAPEISPEGIPRIKERIGAFRNAMNFSRLWKSMADVKTKDDIKLPVPDKYTETVVVPATAQDKAFMAEIADRAEIVRAGEVDASVDNLLKISNDGRLAALDLRMVGWEADGQGKLDAAVERIAAIYHEHKGRKYTDRDGAPNPLTGALQLVFSDRGTPSDKAIKEGRFIAYHYLRDELVARGVPQDLIRFAQDANTAEEKAQLFSDARLGKVAILVGSTDTMGVGVNVQDRAIALHHLDCPWRPSDVTQREGRIVRQFNQHYLQQIPVQVYRWVKEGSFDSFMWQTVERKARFTDQVRTGRDRAEQEQALDGDLGRDYLEFGEIKAIATGNPLLLKQAAADEEVRQLEAAYTNWKRTEQHLRNVVDSADETLAAAQGFADLVGKAVERRAANHTEEFRAELPSGTEVTKRTEAATALRTQLSLMQRRAGREGRSQYEHVATVSGQMIMARVNNGHDFIEFTIRGLAEVPQATFTVDDVNAALAPGKPPVGLITRIENHIGKLDRLHTTLQGVVEELRQEIDRAQKLVGKPFGKMDRLLRARSEQAQINSDIQAQAEGRARTEDDPAEAAAPSQPAASTTVAPAASSSEAASADSSGPSARPGSPPTAPYVDRAASWAAEESVTSSYRQWTEQLGAHLDRGSAEERGLAQAAELLLTESTGARQSRLLGFDHLTGLLVVDDLARQIRAVAEQWDRQQRNPQAVRDTWQLSTAIRDHASRYRATVADPGSAEYRRWASTDEPVNVDDQAAEDAAALLDPLGQYTVTGPGGLSAEPTLGADLAAGVAQLIADGARVEQTATGLVLALADGARYDVVDPTALDVEEPEPLIGADAEVQARVAASDTDSPRSSLPNIEWASVVLGHYVDAAELVAGRELVAATGRQLEGILRQQSASLGHEFTAELSTALTAAHESTQLSPEETFGIYDRLALAASALVDSGEGEVAALAERLQLRTERHLARMQALGNHLTDELMDASALDPESLAVLGRGDPAKERPTPYSDSTHLNHSRSILFQAYDRWPLVSGGGGKAEAALRGSMWERREMPDTRLTAGLPEWLQVVALAMGAADAAEGETRAILRDVAQRAFQHHQHLSAHQLAAAESSPYEDSEAFTQGAEGLVSAWETWLATATARELGEGDGSRPQDAPFTAARAAMEEVQEALRSVELASTEDGTLDEVTRQTTKLAHTTYALVLSLREETFRQRGDQQVLVRLVRTAYEHAAACRAASLQPAAAAQVRHGVAQRQMALGNTPEVPEALPESAVPAVSSAAPLEIEHNYRTTIVRGTTNLPADTEVRRLLDRLGFKYKGKQSHWVLPRSGALADMHQRNERIRRLVQELSKLGRSHQMIETAAQEPPVEIRIPAGEPYATRAEAEEDFRAAFSAYWSLRDTPAGRRLMGSDGRPDGRAVHAALEDLRQGAVGSNLDPFAHPGDAVALRTVELARATQTISQHLAVEKYRAPAALPHLRAMTQYATLLASRISATVADDGRWEELFATPVSAAQPAAAAGEGAMPPDAAAALAEPAPPADDDVSEAAVAPTSTSADPLLAGPYSDGQLAVAVERINSLVAELLRGTEILALADADLHETVKETWETADTAGRVALGGEEEFAAALAAYGKAIDATGIAIRAMEQERARISPALRAPANELISATETHIVRLSLTYRMEQEAKEAARAQRARERAADTATHDARIHEEARDWVVRAASDADSVLSWLHSGTEEEARARFDEWLSYLVVTDPVSGAGTRYEDWIGLSSRPSARTDITADAFAALYSTAPAPDEDPATSPRPAAVPHGLDALISGIDTLPLYEQVGPSADARLAVMATLSLPDGTVDDALLLLQSVEDSGDELDDEPVVRGAQILPPTNLLSTSVEGRWFAGDLLSMQGARILPLREPIPWATVRELAAGTYEAALRALPTDQTSAAAEADNVAEPPTETGEAQAETAHESVGTTSAQEVQEAGPDTAPADLAPSEDAQLVQPATESPGQPGSQEQTGGTEPTLRQRTLEEALGLLPSEQYLGYRGRWGGDYDVAVPGGRYVIRQPGFDRQNFSVRFMPDFEHQTDTVSVASVATVEQVMPRIRRHARQLAEAPAYEEQARRLAEPAAEAIAGADIPGVAEESTELTSRESAVSTLEENMPETAEAAAEGAWSSRIKIVTEGGATFVTGTGGDYFPQEADLRKQLKKSGQNFTFREGRWRYSGRPANRERAIAEIRAYLRTKDAEAAAAEASKPGRYPPTPQQQRIIDSVLAGKDVAVQALAGTGKTSTLLMLTERLPKKRIAYIAFNRAIADEARRKFPRRVTSGTSHSYARTALRNTPLWDKVSRAGRNGGARFPKDVAPLLGLTKPLKFQDGGLEPQEVARIALTAVRRYRESADAELGPQHLGERWADSPVTGRLLRFAQQIWDDKADPESNRFIFEPDDYIKVWALGSPRLPFDLIMFDEAQDINPVLEKVVADQQAQKIVVGDSHQSIYEFRGAIDALKDWPADESLPLTQSWRFGPEVAAVGNAYLRLLDADLVLEGNPSLDSSIGDVDEPDAILTKTNIGAIGAVIEGFDQGKRVALVGGGGDIEAIAKAAQDLQNGRRTKHPELSAFANWNEVREFADTDEDAKALQTLVRLVDRYRPDGLLRMIESLVPEDAVDEESKPELVVSTAHKSKGREWDNVRIGPDFPQPKEDTSTGEVILPPPSELRLAYVTVTRAKARLELGSLDWVRLMDPNLMARASASRATEVAPAEEVAVTDALTELDAEAETPEAAATAVSAQGAKAASESPAAVAEEQPAAATAPAQGADSSNENEELARAEGVAEPAPLPWDTAKIRQRGVAGLRREEKSPVPNLRTEIVNAVGRGQEIGDVWRQDNPWAQFHANLRHVLAALQDDEPASSLVEDIATELQGRIEQIADRASTHYNGLIVPLAGNPAALDALDQQLVADNRIPEIGNAFAREALILVLQTLDDAEQTAASRKINSSVVRDALDQVVGLAGVRLHPGGESNPGVDAALAPVEVQLDAARELIAELGLNATALETYGRIRTLIADHEQQAQAPKQSAEAAAPEEAAHLAELAEAASTPVSEAEPLTDRDIAVALGRISDHSFGQWIFHSDGERKHTPQVFDGFFRMPARPGEDGNAETGSVWSRTGGLDITVSVGGTEVRTGRITWAKALAWLRPALTEQRKEILNTAWTTGNALARTEDGFRVIGEHDRFRAVQQEVQKISGDLVRTLVDESLQAHLTGQAETLIARNRRDADEPDDGLISLESLVDPDTARERAAGEQTLERLRTIRAVLPDHHTQHVPLSEITAGDAFWSISPQRLPFVAQGAAEVSGGTTMIAGVLGLASGQARPYTWVHDHTDLTQLVPRLLLPTTLAGLTDVAADTASWSTDNATAENTTQAAELPEQGLESTAAAEAEVTETAPEEPGAVVEESQTVQPAGFPVAHATPATEPAVPAAEPYSTLEDFTADLDETRQAFTAWSGSPTVRRLNEHAREMRSLTDGPVINEAQQIQEPWLDLMLALLGAREIDVQETAQRLRRFDEVATATGRSLRDMESFADVADRQALQKAIGGARRAADRMDATASLGTAALHSDAAGSVAAEGAAEAAAAVASGDAAPQTTGAVADGQRPDWNGMALFGAELARLRETHQAWAASMTAARLTHPANAAGGQLAARIQTAWEQLEQVTQDRASVAPLLAGRLRELAEAVAEVGRTLTASSQYASPVDRHVLLALFSNAIAVADQIEAAFGAQRPEPVQAAPEPPAADQATTQAVAERLRSLAPSEQADNRPDRSAKLAQAAWRTGVRKAAEGEFGATAKEARAFGEWYIDQGHKSSKDMPRTELAKLYEQWQRATASPPETQDTAVPVEQEAAPTRSTEAEPASQAEVTTVPEVAAPAVAPGPVPQSEATPEPASALVEPEASSAPLHEGEPEDEAAAASAPGAVPHSPTVPDPAVEADDELAQFSHDDPGVEAEPWVDVIGEGIVGDTELVNEPDFVVELPENPARADRPAAAEVPPASTPSGAATDDAAPSDQGAPTQSAPTVPSLEEVVAEPPVPRAVEPDELDRHFASIVQALRSPARLSPQDQQRLELQYADLRSHLADLLGALDSAPVQPQGTEPSVDAADAAELDAAIGAAQAEAGAYWGTPEWQSIRDVHQASQALRSAVRDAVMTHAEALVRDVRTHGLDRTIQAWAARAVSHSAYLLARRLDSGGMRDSAAWRAVWRLHRAASTRADRLTGLLPAGQRIDLATQLRSAWQWLADSIASRLPDRADDGASGHQLSLIARSFETVRGNYQTAADRIADWAQHPLWRRIVTVFESARQALDGAHAGLHRLAADHATLGTGRTLWVRTLEIIAHSARSLLDRLEHGGHRDGLRWNALRVLHHAAEEGISHLRGLVPEHINSPLGTYYEPERGTAEEAAVSATALGAEPAATADTAQAEEANRPAATAPVSNAAASTPQEEAQGPENWEQLREAVDFVVGAPFAAELLVRRRLSIDSEQTLRVMGRLEGLGIVGRKEGDRLRPVLVRDREEARRILAQAQQAGQPDAAPAAERAPAPASAAPADPVEAPAVVAEAIPGDQVSAPGLPQRQRSAARPGPGQPRPAAVQRQPDADPGASTQAVLTAQAKRLADKATFAVSAASNPREQAAAATLQKLATKTKDTADLMAQGPAAATPERGALMAEPFLRALRMMAAASGAALPEDVVQSAWAAAVKATGGPKSSSPGAGGPGAGTAPAGKGGQQQTDGRRAQQREQQQRQEQQRATPHGPRM
ncbi:UvrD-helicase domain-containing protein [Streptacidiphilus melanogenes]|uniref:UvrD-helicase domain-containing protein n=1 Tax=Streptacidiphilus melanogenes TaxID=411235 RepID=UPI000694362A|nr:UvrD-helicase domain-containing protein [Streptacidiphilus melanogenes]